MEKNTLYLDCNSGISGDMTVAALLDLGASEEELRKVLAAIPTKGFSIEISRVKKAGLDVCDFDVVLDEAHENHDHDMEYLYGHLHEESHDHHEDHEHNHHEDHDHDHHEDHDHEHNHHGDHDHDHHEDHGHDHHHDHHHEHRGMKEITEIINATQMREGARKIAIRIFRILAEAESKAHGVPVEEVHFHEVGAIDSIVDIVAVAVCLDNLNVTKCVVPFICEGSGTVRCQHGILPIPVPAVTHIAAAWHLPVQITQTKGELITPTGAAIVAAIMTDTRLPECFTISRLGMGGGKRTYDRPSILRAMLIESGENQSVTEESRSVTEPRNLTEESNTAAEESQSTAKESQSTAKESQSTSDFIWKLESNIDDCSGENMGYVMEKLLEAGARDAYFVPVFMKKNRPAYELNVICKDEDRKKLEYIIFEETTTIGIRRQRMERTIMKRRVETIETSLGKVQIKICELDGEGGEKIVKLSPEYESVAAVCRASQEAFQVVYDQIKKEGYTWLKKH